MAEYYGIDVCSYQGDIDWAKVAKAGIKFAILKATRRDNTIDKKFKDNFSGCVANGISIGAYRYIYAKTVLAAKAEASAMVDVLMGKHINCKVWLDIEDDSLLELSKDGFKAVIAAERQVLEKAGFEVGIYCSENWYKTVLPVSDKNVKDMPFWLARYGSNNGAEQPKYKPSTKNGSQLFAWQYTSVGELPGINHLVDLDVAYGDIGAHSIGTAVSVKAYDTIRKGDTGKTVKVLQKYLNKFGNKLDVDGAFGTRTRNAVCVFQSEHKLVVDGIVGAKTWMALQGVKRMTNLTISSKGAEVKLLQKRLNVCGYKLEVDGIFGIATANAVGSCQKVSGLVVDHIVGPKTEAALLASAMGYRTHHVGSEIIKHRMGYAINGYKAKGTLEATLKLKRPGCTCGHFVSWVFGGIGLIKHGKTVTHSKEGSGIGPKAIKGAKYLVGCDIMYPNKPLDKCGLEEWDVVVHDSSIGIYAVIQGKPTIVTGRSGVQTLDSGGMYQNLYVTSGYEWNHNVLAVIRPVK